LAKLFTAKRRSRAKKTPPEGSPKPAGDRHGFLDLARHLDGWCTGTR
jgi:hypothetical protein